MNEVNYLNRYKIIKKAYDLNVPGSGKLSRILAKLLIPAPKNTVVAENCFGFKLQLDPLNDRNGIEYQLYWRGFYEQGTLQVINNFLRTGDTFFDIGANIGVISLSACQTVQPGGKVFSFEPHPQTLAILRENISMNNADNITVMPYALGASEGKATIFSSPLPENRGSATLVNHNMNETGFEIDVKRLDDFATADFNIAMMKIDVEGFEMEVLKGGEKILRSVNAPALVLECSVTRDNFNYSPAEMYRYLLSLNNYNVYKLKKGMMRLSTLVKINNESELPEHDNIFCFLPSQLQRITKILS